MKKYTSLFKLIVITLMVLILSTFLGDNISDFFTINHKNIILNFRLPRVLFGFLTGGILSIIGVIVQKLFNNKIATGQTLGITSASSAGAASAIFISSVTGFINFPTWIMAISFSLISSLIIVILFNKFKSSSYTIIAGVSLSLMFSSLVMLLQYLTPYTETKSLMMYLTGSLTVYGYFPIIILSITTILLLSYTIKKSFIIDAISIGKGFSLSRGIKYQKEFGITLLIVSIALSISVTLSGPIMFVGLIIPNILYKKGILSTKKRVIYSLFYGGIFITLTDAISRALFSFELPIGIITGILGSIFMIYILMKKD